MPLSMLLARLRHYRYETLALSMIFIMLTLLGMWSQHHISTTQTAYISDFTANARAGDTEIRLRSSEPITPETETEIRDILGDQLISLGKLQRTGGLGCGLERNCHQGFAIENPERHITLVEGNFPQATGDPTTVQALLSREIADHRGYTVGTVFTFAVNRSNPISVEVVGIFEPNDPDSRYWFLNEILIEGIETPIGANTRYDFGFMVTQEVFDSVLVPLVREFRGSSYSYFLQVQPIADNLSGITTQLNRVEAVERAFTQRNSQGTVATIITNILAELISALRLRQSQLWVMALLATLLIASYGVYIHHNATRHQMEWQRIPEMGFHARTILQFRGQILALIAVPSLILGLVIGSLIWNVPSPLSIFLACIAVAIGYVMMLVAGQSTTADDRRPSQPPVMLDAQLDILLIITGIILVIRLIALNATNLGDTFQQFIAQPSTILSLIDPTAAHAPLNLLIPFTLAIGVLLLGLRLIWQVRPQHALPIVTVLLSFAVTTVGTVLLLQNQLSAFHRDLAIQQTGGSARALVNPDEILDLPDEVISYAEIVIVEDGSNNRDVISLIGIDTEQFTSAFPEFSEMLMPLNNEDPIPLSGLPLPDDTIGLSVDVYSFVTEDNFADDTTPVDITISLDFRILDNRGMAIHIPADPLTEAIPNQFVTYTAQLPDTPHAPYRLAGLVVDVMRSDTISYQHMFQFDEVAVLRDGNISDIIQDFEASSLPDEWQLFAQDIDTINTHLRFAQPARGEGSLRTVIQVTDGREVIIPIARATRTNMPVLVSPMSAEWLDGRIIDSEEVVGDNFQPEFNLPLGYFTSSLAVVGIVDDFPVVGDGRYIIYRQQDLLFYLNNRADRNRAYSVSEVWLNFPDNFVPTDTLRSQLPASTIFTEDLYNTLQSDPLPRLMIDYLWGVLLLLILPIILLLITHSKQWQSLLVSCILAVLLGSISAIVLATVFPIFSIA